MVLGWWDYSTTLSTTNLNSHNENATYKRLKRSQAMVEMDLSQIGNDERRTRTSYKDKMKRDADNMMSELANRYKIHPLIVKIAEDEFALYRDAKEALQDFEGIVHSCLYLAYEEATHRSEMVDIRDIHVTQLFVKRSEVKLPVADSSDAAVATLDGKPIRTWGVAHVREWLTAVATCSSTSSTQAPSISVIIKSEKQGAEASMDVVSDSLASDEFQADGKDEKPGTVADAAATAAATTTADTGAATATAGATVATTANPSTTVARRQLALLAYADGIYEYLETELATHRLRQRNGTSLSHSVTDSATAADTCTVAIADGTTTTGSTGGGNAAGEEATAAIKSENMGKVRGPPTTGITNSGLSGPIGAVSAAEQTAAVFKFLGTTTIEGRRKIEEMERKKKQQQKQHVLAVNKGRQGNEEEGAAVSTTSSSMAPVVTDDESSMGQLLVTLRFRAAVSARLREREPKHSNTQIQSSIDNPAASPLSSSLPPSSLPSLPSSSSSTSTALSFVVLSSSWTVEEVESLIAEAEKLFADAIRRRCSFERLVREAHEEMQLQSQSQSQSQQATGVSKKSDVAPAPPNKTAKLTQKLSSNIGGQSQSHVRNALLDHVKSENGTPSTVNGSNGVRMGGLLKQRVERPLLAVAPMKDSVVDAFEDFFGASVPMVSDVSSDAQDAVDVKTEKEQDKQDGMGGKASIDGTKEIKPNAKVMKKKKVAVVVE